MSTEPPGLWTATQEVQRAHPSLKLVEALRVTGQRLSPHEAVQRRTLEGACGCAQFSQQMLRLPSSDVVLHSADDVVS